MVSYQEKKNPNGMENFPWVSEIKTWYLITLSRKAFWNIIYKNNNNVIIYLSPKTGKNNLREQLELVLNCFSPELFSLSLVLETAHLQNHWLQHFKCKDLKATFSLWGSSYSTPSEVEY